MQLEKTRDGKGTGGKEGAGKGNGI